MQARARAGRPPPPGAGRLDRCRSAAPAGEAWCRCACQRRAAAAVASCRRSGQRARDGRRRVATREQEAVAGPVWGEIMRRGAVEFFFKKKLGCGVLTACLAANGGVAGCRHWWSVVTHCTVLGFWPLLGFRSLVRQRLSGSHVSGSRQAPRKSLCKARRN